jgi:hypothetical protein
MEISITRALSELKNLDKRIHKKINEGHFVAMTKGTKPVKGYKNNQKYEEDVQKTYQSINSLIRQKQKLKNAIVLSNASTKVEITSKEFTVAEIIEYKNLIHYKQELLNKLKMDFLSAHDKAELENMKVKERLDSLLEANFTKETRAKETEVEMISKPFLEANEAKTIDPLDARKKINELEEEIDTFLSEVDFVLSESNAKTLIKVED